MVSLVDADVDAARLITWGPICHCGRPTVFAHRHGTSQNGVHLSVLRQATLTSSR